MTIRALIVDLDGTIVRNDGTVVPDIKEAFSQLSRMGIRIVIVSDRPRSEGVTKIAGLQYSPDLFITRSEVGTPKGSPKWAEYVCDALTVEPRDLLYLGDTDHDMWTAVNSHILYLNAAWSNPTFQYGIQVSSPAMLAPLLENFFTKEALWYWTLDTIDRLGRQVQAKTMIDGAGAGVLSIRYGLLGWTKFDSDSNVGAFKLGSFFMLHLLGSIYLDGLYESADWWTTYPGSTGKTNAVMDEFITIAAKLFRDKFKPGLLARHSPAVDSGQARVKHQGVTFMNQVNTVCLNDDPNIAEQIRGKSIVVIDDFVTEGYSSECARNLLLKAGAASVTTVAIGKYGSGFKCESPRPGLNWSPFVPNKLKVTDFLELSVRGSFNENALSCFRESYLKTSKSGNKF
jgi:hypothetical protein